MTLSELIELFTEYQKEYGDIEVQVYAPTYGEHDTHWYGLDKSMIQFHKYCESSTIEIDLT